MSLHDQLTLGLSLRSSSHRVVGLVLEAVEKPSSSSLLLSLLLVGGDSRALLVLVVVSDGRVLVARRLAGGSAGEG